MTDGSLTRENAGSHADLDPSSLLGPTLAPFTRRLFTEAGLKPGMRVLDVCSGAGDVAFIAREVVGKTGRVVGFDEPPTVVAYANERATYRRLENVEFVSGTLDNPPPGEQFDAVVGRLVLMYRRDPTRDLRGIVELLRPGGLVVFQELDLLAATSLPRAVHVEKAREWILDTFRLADIDAQMGLKLHPAYRSAGLVSIQMRVDGLIGGSESPLPALLSDVAETIIPPFHPVASTHELEALEERIRNELAESGGVMSSALLISAWAIRPDN
jgi:SAM-dependent methyltransferase